LGLGNVQVLAYQGKAKLAEFLSDLSKLSGASQIKCLAITRDADEDAAAAYESVNYAIAHSPEWVQKLRAAVYILPGEGKQGALESLWLRSLEDDPRVECVEAFFDCIQAKGWIPSAVFSKKDKARAQLWIAMKDTPNERFGIAAWHGRRETDKPWMKDSWVNFDHPAFDELRQFLIAVFGS
jgi:hypothetical protein